MRVIFIKDLKKQAKKGDIKEVKDGYGKNFLIKNGYAVLATETSSKILEEDKKQSAKKEAELRKEANGLKNRLEKEKINFKLQSNQGKTFGSVSTKTIHEDLIKRGFEVDKKKIKPISALNFIGIHEVEVELYKDIKAILKIEIISG